MARVQVRPDADFDPAALDEPVLVDGLPGLGLVGKLAADHLAEQFGTRPVADVRCGALHSAAVYGPESSSVRTPVRIEAAPANDLLVLRSDVPVPVEDDGFAEAVIETAAEWGATPLCVGGMAVERADAEERPAEVWGVATPGGQSHLDRAGIVPPAAPGVLAGPAGALLDAAAEREVPAVGLVVEADADAPDPTAARAVLERGLAPLADVDADAEGLFEGMEALFDAGEELASRMGEGGEDSSRAQPLSMFQ
jgi:uncharacterized protein